MSSSSCCGNVSLILSCYDPATNTFKLEGSGGSFDLATASCSPFIASFIGSILLDNCMIGSIVVDTNPANPFCSSSSSSSSISSTSGNSTTNCCNTVLPNTLNATITGCCSGNIVLTFSINRWVGSNTICGRTLTVSFCADPNIGTPCGCFNIYYEWSDSCGTPNPWGGTCTGTSLTCTCSPFQVSTLADALTCCGGNVTITITI